MSFTNICTFNNMFAYTKPRAIIVNKNLWIAGGGSSSGNIFVYSKNGVTWTGIPGSLTVFYSNVYGVAYSLNRDMWTAAGLGVKPLVYSKDGFTWTKSSVSVFTSVGTSVAYSEARYLWTATGSGGGTTLAYSTDGIMWSNGTNIFTSQGLKTAYGDKHDIWTVAGKGTNSLGYSKDGVNWTASPSGKIAFNLDGYCVAYSTDQDLWIAGGTYTPTGNSLVTGNSLAYSTDGFNWIGIAGSGAIFLYCQCVTYSKYQDIWVSGGVNAASSTKTLAYSKNGYIWTGISGSSSFMTPYDIAYNTIINIWTAVGGYGNKLAYSKDGTTWTAVVGNNSLFNNTGYGVATNT